ncbi:MAG TPA: hypothetical protein VMV72_09195 [Verrucomicrobiae bacterium]|nr:hypothetical protein [Verrucomicrobiae bacterium]
MRLSDESPQARRFILLAFWLIVVVFSLGHAWETNRYLRAASAVTRAGRGTGTPFQLLNFADAVDGKVWVRNATDLVEEPGVWRLRHTTSDNAPVGREVHWSSGWAWWLIGLGAVERAVTDEPWPKAIETMSVWAHLPVLWLGVALFSWWIARRAGAAAGALTAVALFGHPGMYEGFWPADPDHHGLVSMAVFGLVCGALLAGAGWWRESEDEGVLPRNLSQARRAAAVSALCGAAGMWVSAASVALPIAETGVAGVVVAVWLRSGLRARGFRFAPEIWRLWGRVGAGASVLFYLLEYAPRHLGMRLEVNHPLYALAWWGGGEAVARIGERLASGESVFGAGAARWLAGLVPAVLATLVAPLAALFGPESWFVLRDPFLLGIHREIGEFLPIWGVTGKWHLVVMFAVMTMPVWAAIVVLAGRNVLVDVRLAIGFTLVCAALATVQACVQVRWYMMASGPQILLGVLVVTGLFAARGPGEAVRWRWVLSVGVCLLLYLPWPVADVGELWQPGYLKSEVWVDWVARDIAGAIRATSPAGSRIVVLADPAFSVEVGYFGRMGTVGTLYWENTEGLKAAAAILTAYSDEEAAALIRARNITHLVLIDGYDFTAQYQALAHPRAAPEDFRRTLGGRILRDHQPPLWLRPLPYATPPDLPSFPGAVLVFKVDFGQSPAEAYYRRGQFHLHFGEKDLAAEDFSASSRLAAENPAP